MERNPQFIFAPYEILQDSRLSLRQIRVLLAILSWRKRNTNLARVSRAILSGKTGYPPQRISQITSQLVKLGWLEKHGNGGRSQWIEYEVSAQNGDQFGNGNQFGIETDTESVTQKVTETVTPIDTATSTVTNTVTNFNDFWSVYPRKEGKSSADKTWKKLSEVERQLAISDCQIRFKNQERKFVPHGSTYLNQKRWVDELDVEQPNFRKEFPI